MAHRLTRRRFMQSTAATGMALPFIRPSWAQAGDSILNVACIGGAGGKGTSDTSEMSHHPNARIAAICDIDEGRLGRAGNEYPDATLHTDYRAMLTELGDTIDCVTVSGPDHMHAHATMMALDMGKHVYVQKPLAHSVQECRMLRTKQAETGLVCQMGNQAHSTGKHMEMKKILQSGVLGKISRAHAWSNRPIWPQGGDRPRGGETPPEHINWDLWLNGAPERPYLPDTYHPFKWRGFWDFGTGAFGDMGCHILDIVTDGLSLGSPTSLICDCPAPAGDMHPRSETVVMKYPPTMVTAYDGCTVTWHDGGNVPNEDNEPALADFVGEYSIAENGNIFVGERGIMVVDHYGPYTLLMNDVDEEPVIPESNGVHHYHGWLRTILGEGTPENQNRSNFFVAAPLTETCLLGCLSARFPGQELRWDAARMMFTNNREANRFVTKRYRDGFDPNEFA